MGLKEEIVLANDLPVCRVEVEHWPAVYVRTLSVGELERLTQIDAEKMEASSYAKICAMVLCDEDGNSIFDDDDYKLLMKKPFSALRAIVDAALEHNGLGEDALAEAQGN